MPGRPLPRKASHMGPGALMRTLRNAGPAASALEGNALFADILECAFNWLTSFPGIIGASTNRAA
eukprot:1043710-Lingulodinium_polyedra.AAC.1